MDTCDMQHRITRLKGALNHGVNKVKIFNAH